MVNVFKENVKCFCDHNKDFAKGKFYVLKDLLEMFSEGID